MTASTITGNTSKAIERHLSSSYQVVLYVAKNLDKITDLVNLMKYFDNFYVGAYTTPPSTTPSGKALTAGMFYLNLVDDHLYYWTQLNGVYAWYKMDIIATNVIAQFDAHAAGVTASFTQLAEGHNTTFLTYLNDTRTYRNETDVMYQQILLMHAAVINAYDQVLPVLEHIEAIESVSGNIVKVNTVADNIGSVNAVANNMPAVINAGAYVNQIANAVASTHADALATAADRVVTQNNAASTSADRAAVTGMRDEVEADRVEVASNAATVAGQTAQVAADTALTQTNRNEAVAANAQAKQWATGNTPVGDLPSDTNNARYYSEVAKANANQTFKSGGLFTPTAGQEYPDVTGVSVDTVWLIKFPDAADSYLYGSGSLAGQTVRNGYQLYYDTPVNTFGVIATTLSGVQKVNGKNPNALGEVTLTADDLSDVYSQAEVNAGLAQKAQDDQVVKLAGNQTINGTKTFAAAVKGVKAVADEDLPTKAQMDVLASGMSQAQFEAIREQNKAKYAASGFVHFGKHIDGGVQVPINQGLFTRVASPTENSLFLGRIYQDAVGSSKTNHSVLTIAGVQFDLIHIGETFNGTMGAQIKFPQAPNGTITYDSATGTVTDYTKQVDPKYGDIAGTVSEAASRAFEGRMYNGDGRKGAWTADLNVTSTVSDRRLTLECHTAGGVGQSLLAIAQGENLYGKTCVVELYVHELVQQGTYEPIILAQFSTVSLYAPLKLGHNRFTFVSNDADGLTVGIRLQGDRGNKVVFSNFSVREVTNEVVINRVDMWGFEAFLEEVNTTNPYVYPNGLIQSQAATMDGIAASASARPVTYYAVFDGDTGSKGKGLNFFTLTDAQKKKVLGNAKNNLYYLDDGRLVQWRLRQRTIAGAGNGDWRNVNSIYADGVFSTNYNSRFLAQGVYDSITSIGNDGIGIGYLGYAHAAKTLNQDVGLFSGRHQSLSAISGECYFLVCGTVDRMNQGAYHPSFNPSGAALFTGGNPWHIADVPNTLFCFTNNVLGSLSNGYSGRPDGRYYDAIYASGQGGVCRDMRYSAYGVDLVDFAEADQRVKNGTYRGFEFGRITKVISFVTSSSETASNYGRVPMTRAEALRVCGLIGVSTEGATIFHQAKMAVSLYNPNNGKVIHSSAILATQGNSNFGTYLDPANPSAIWLGFDQKVVENNLSGNQVLRVAGDTGSADSNIFCSSGQTLYAIVTTLDKVSVGGSFLQTDVIGNPANILATPQLANGWQGSWIPYTASDWVMSRKAINSVGSQVFTSDNGTTWGNAVLTINTVTNATPAGANNLVWIGQYQTFAKQAENAANAKVYGSNAGVGDVINTAGYLPDYGALLMESLIGRIAIGSANICYRSSLNSYGFFSDGRLLSDLDYPILHNQVIISAVNNNSPALKTLNYNVNINQQANIQYAYTELKHNGTNWGDDGKVTIVDNQSTKTDLNGNKVLVGTAKLKEPIGWIKNTI